MAGPESSFAIKKRRFVKQSKTLDQSKITEISKLNPTFYQFLDQCPVVFEDKNRLMYLFPKEQLHYVISELFRPGVHASFYIFPFNQSTKEVEKAPWFTQWNQFHHFSSPVLFDTFSQVVKEFGWLLTTHNHHPYLKPLCFYTAPGVAVIPPKGTIAWQHFDDMYALLDQYQDLQVQDHPRRGLRSKYAPSQLRSMQELTLINTDIVHLEDLKEYPNITSLALYHNFVWNLGNTLEQMTHLKRLTLGQMEVDSYDFLEGMTSLKYLQINRVYNDGILTLPAMPRLEALDLESTFGPLGNGKLKSLELTTPLENLKSINLDSTEIKDLSFIKKCPALEKLVLHCTPITDLSILKDLPTLKSLSLGYMDTLDLPELPQLEHLDLAENALESLQDFFHLPSLKGLALRQNNLKSLAELAHFPALEYLDVTNNSIENLENLPELPQLQTLLLSSLDSADYTPLQKQAFPKLAKLMLAGSGIDNLTNIQHFKYLEDLNLSAYHLKDLRLLETLPHLKKLCLRRCNVTENNLSQVHLPQLAFLNLDGGQFTNLQFLKNFPQLKELSLGNLSGSYEKNSTDLSDLKAIALPHLEILDIHRTLPKDWQPLLELQSLKKIIITGRLIPKAIIQQFEEKGVMVEDGDIW